ncbi:MAG: ACT domain-containing protein [Eggerthellaceae bacterium]|nr:ACT domain-containing protein [Eggerthellaceae bacterium]
MKCVVSVLGKDRTGIVAAVATALTECSANIDDISQTILGEGEIFSMTMLVTIAPEVCDFNTVQDKLTKVGDDLGLQVIIQREDVFSVMYKI